MQEAWVQFPFLAHFLFIELKPFILFSFAGYRELQIDSIIRSVTNPPNHLVFSICIHIYFRSYSGKRIYVRGTRFPEVRRFRGRSES